MTDLDFIQMDIPTPKGGAWKHTERSGVLRDTTNLGVWMDRCCRAGVRCIPAHVLARFNLEQLLLVPDKQANEATVAALDAGKAAFDLYLKSDRKIMWRWDCCASSGTKCSAGEGESVEEIIKSNHSDLLMVDDPRFYDIAYDLYMAGVTEMAAYIRPYIQPAVWGEYPIEFRVFVTHKHQEHTVRADGKAFMCANYYIQRPLPEAYKPGAEEAIKLAEKICAYNSDVKEASMDFLMDTHGEVFFLEGGPGWGYGAHPCSLNPDEPFVNGKISLKPEWNCL